MVFVAVMAFFRKLDRERGADLRIRFLERRARAGEGHANAMALGKNLAHPAHLEDNLVDLPWFREPHMRENLAWLNRFTLSLSKQRPGKDSIAMKRRACGWGDSPNGSIDRANALVSAGPDHVMNRDFVRLGPDAVLPWQR